MNGEGGDLSGLKEGEFLCSNGASIVVGAHIYWDGSDGSTTREFVGARAEIQSIDRHMVRCGPATKNGVVVIYAREGANAFLDTFPRHWKIIRSRHKHRPNEGPLAAEAAPRNSL